MTASPQWAPVAASLLCAAAAAACQRTPEPDASADTTVRTALSQSLPAMDGSRLRVTVLEVGYRPGGSSAPHRHPCAVIGYVIAGALRSRTDSAPEAIYHAGESFYEAPNSVHRISANASDREPVRFTAAFICDREAPLSVAVSQPDSSRGRVP